MEIVKKENSNKLQDQIKQLKEINRTLTKKKFDLEQELDKEKKKKGQLIAKMSDIVNSKNDKIKMLSKIENHWIWNVICFFNKNLKS